MPTKPRRKYEYSGPFHDLLRLVFDNTSESWVELARALAASLGPGRTFTNLNLVGEGKKIASNDLAGALLKRCVDANIKIPTALARPLLEHCDKKGVRIPRELERELRELAQAPATDEANGKSQGLPVGATPDSVPATAGPVTANPTSQRPQKPKEYAIVSAMGLDKDAADQSIEHHSGRYLHFSLDDSENIIVSRCRLLKTRGVDHAPVYRAWRQIPKLGGEPRYYVGGYFATYNHLYLLASREDSIDFRMSIFHVIRGKVQKMHRGIWLGVPDGSKIFTSRCVLMKLDEIDREIWKQMLQKPQPKARFPMLADGLKEVSDYLLGEAPPFIEFSVDSGF